MLTENHGVGGSIPPLGTNDFKGLGFKPIPICLEPRKCIELVFVRALNEHSRRYRTLLPHSPALECSSTHSQQPT
jgi:hypothetical protein